MLVCFYIVLINEEIQIEANECSFLSFELQPSFFCLHVHIPPKRLTAEEKEPTVSEI